MHITKTWIATNFSKFNEKYFNNTLPTPTFTLCNTKNMLGQCGTKNKASRNFYIKISNYFDRTEHEFQNTLLHEMIHLNFQSKGEWSVHHGQKFQQMARSFDKYGWNIHTTEEGFHGKVTNGIIPQRLVMVFEEPSYNRVWMCCVADVPHKIASFKRTIENSKSYKNYAFYTTTSDKFCSLKTSHSRLGGKVVSNIDFLKDYLPYLIPINR